MEPVRQQAGFGDAELARELFNTSRLVRRTSSSGVWARQQGGAAARAPVVVAVRAADCSTGSGSSSGGASWSGSLGPADCTVELAAGQPGKVLSAPAGRRPRRWLARLLAVLLLLAAGAAVALIAISQTVGLRPLQMEAEVQLLPPPAQQQHRLLLAFTGGSRRAAPADALPAELAAAHVSSWAVAASSGIHVATLHSQQGLQAVLAALAADPQLRYAVTDFELLPDRGASRVIDPDELFQLAAGQGLGRQLLQQERPAVQPRGQPGSRQGQGQQPGQHHEQHQEQQEQGQTEQRRQLLQQQLGVWAAEQRARRSQARLQRLAHREGRRRQLLLEHELLLAVDLPATVLPRLQDPQPQQQQQQQQHDGNTAAHACSHGGQVCEQAAAAASGQDGSGGSSDGGACASEPGLRCSSSDSSDAGNTQHRAQQPQRRRLQQRAGQLPLMQLQQRQAMAHVQKGGTGVAWYLASEAVQMPAAWNVSYGDDALVVAVIDSGVELSHGGVGASMWVNGGEEAGDGIDNDGNGFVDDVLGWDFAGSCVDAACSSCSPGPDPSDTAGWGTHAAAVVAAQPEVAAGTAGLAPGARIMALKVADCRAGLQLADLGGQQLRRAGAAPGWGEVGLQQQQQQQAGGTASAWMGAAAGPTMWGSAAVQALNYALLNGAHIVLAAWQAANTATSAGMVSSGSSNESAAAAAVVGDTPVVNCLLGPQHTGAAASTDACVAAVQRLLFEDALRPLEQAGVLVITSGTHDSSSSSSSSSSGSSDSSGADAADVPAAAALPCSLACSFSNVLCVGQSAATAGVDSLTNPISAAAMFARLTAPPDVRPASDSANSSSANATSTNSTSADANSTAAGASRSASSSSSSSEEAGEDAAGVPLRISNPGTRVDFGQRGGSRSSSSRAAYSCSASGGVQLLAPGTQIRAGWAWGSHAVVSGSSAAAAVAAGAAALTWSALGQALGGEASAGAFEGLGPTVKQLMLDGSGASSSDSSGLSSSRGGGGGGSSSSNGGAVPAGMVRRGGADDGSVAAEAGSHQGAGAAVVGELDLLAVLQQASSFAGPLSLQPAALPSTLTLASPALSYSWYISSRASGPFDTAAMSLVARKVLPASALPLREWEFEGGSALVELDGYVRAAAAGSHALAVTSSDRFLLWLADKWVAMQPIGPVGPAVGLHPAAWVAPVSLSAPGYYRLRVIVYQPSAPPFDIRWMAPGESAFRPIPAFASFGVAQPLPTQLLHSVMRHMGGGGSSESSSHSSGGEAQAGGGSSAAPVDEQQHVPPARRLQHSPSRALAAPRAALPGVFAVAAGLLPPSGARSLMPGAAWLQFSHSGVLAGAGLEAAPWQLQQQLLGATDGADARGVYGLVQGWLDWGDLNADAVTWLAAAADGSEAAGSDGGASGVAMLLGTAGVQFQVACRACSLHVDGLPVAGGLVLRDGSGDVPSADVALSGCVVPARHALAAADSTRAAARRLLHLELLFTEDALPGAVLSVRSRPCVVGADGAAHLPPGADGGFALLAPVAGGPSGYGVASAAVESGAALHTYMRGMLCSVTAAPPPRERAAAGIGGSSSGSSSGGESALHRVVVLTAEQLQQAAAASIDVSSSNSSADGSASSAELTARAVAAARGISVAALAPDWAASLPATTTYSFACGAFWNGSWAGNVSVGLRPGSGGAAGAYLAGWPVASQQPVLPRYGPSDVNVALFSSWHQQQLLAASSTSADALTWPAAGAAAASGAAAWLGYRLPRASGASGVLSLGQLVVGPAGLAVPAAPPAGHHQLLVIEGRGLTAQAEVVMIAAVPRRGKDVSASEYDGGSSDDDLHDSGDGGGEGGDDSAAPPAPALQGWLPGPWDAWVPA